MPMFKEVKRYKLQEENSKTRVLKMYYLNFMFSIVPWYNKCEYTEFLTKIEL
jgi:hypothetical protein